MKRINTDKPNKHTGSHTLSNIIRQSREDMVMLVLFGVVRGRCREVFEVAMCFRRVCQDHKHHPQMQDSLHKEEETKTKNKMRTVAKELSTEVSWSFRCASERKHTSIK